MGASRFLKEQRPQNRKSGEPMIESRGSSSLKAESPASGHSVQLFATVMVGGGNESTPTLYSSAKAGIDLRPTRAVAQVHAHKMWDSMYESH